MNVVAVLLLKIWNSHRTGFFQVFIQVIFTVNVSIARQSIKGAWFIGVRIKSRQIYIESIQLWYFFFLASLTLVLMSSLYFSMPVFTTCHFFFVAKSVKVFLRKLEAFQLATYREKWIRFARQIFIVFIVCRWIKCASRARTNSKSLLHFYCLLLSR